MLDLLTGEKAAHEPGHLYSVHQWEIDNKYYTAKVKVCTVTHEKYACWCYHACLSSL